MTSNAPQTISFHPEKCSEKHPHEPRNHLDTDNPRWNRPMTATTLTALQKIGNKRNKLIPTERLGTADTLASSQKKRLLDISLHDNTTETANAGSCEEKSNSQ